MFRKSFLLAFIAAWTLTSCASISTFNSLYYQSSDNESITLLEWEYAGKKGINILNKDAGIRRISFGSNKLGDEIKIRWKNNQNNEILSSNIPLNKGLPFNMRSSEIRLTFNNSNEPEIYIFYKGPGPYISFQFKKKFYTESKVRQVFPIIQEIKINAKIINRSYV